MTLCEDCKNCVPAGRLFVIFNMYSRKDRYRFARCKAFSREPLDRVANGIVEPSYCQVIRDFQFTPDCPKFESK